MKRVKGRRGFTLLELIIVVIIIGILASIALPRYIAMAEKGRVAEAKSMLDAIRSAQMRYAAQYGTYAQGNNLGALDVVLQAPRYFYPPTGAAANPDMANDSVIVGYMGRNNQDNPTSTNCNYSITVGGVIAVAAGGNSCSYFL